MNQNNEVFALLYDGCDNEGYSDTLYYLNNRLENLMHLYKNCKNARVYKLVPIDISEEVKKHDEKMKQEEIARRQVKIEELQKEIENIK